MPFIEVHTTRNPSPPIKRELGLTLSRAYAEAMQIQSHIVNVAFTHYDVNDIARYDGPNNDPQEMTIVTCEVRSGRTPAQIESLGRAITELCAGALGIPELRVAVYITEHASHHIYRDGAQAPPWTPSEAKPD